MKKAISIILLIVFLINILTITSKAETISSADLYSKKYFYGLLKWKDIELECEYVVYKKDGVEYPAYCLQRELKGVTTDSKYSVTIDKLVSNVMVWRTIINGYPYKTIDELGCETKEEAFMATKQAVYCILYNRDINSYSAIGKAGKRCLNAMKQIVENAKSSNATKISADIQITAESSQWKVDGINKEYVSQIFEVTSKGAMHNYTINVEGDLPEGTKITDINNNEKTSFNVGEKFKIIIPIKNIEEDGSFKINVQGQVNTKPVLYGKSADSSRQDYALTASEYEEGSGSKKIYYFKNQTKVVIIKKDNKTQTNLEGVEFEILDNNKNVIYTGLKTNKEGKIEINNLVPGIYYIKETKTLDGYEIYDKLIKVELELNEEMTINVINNEKEESIEIEKNETELTVENSSNKVTVKLPKTGM